MRINNFGEVTLNFLVVINPNIVHLLHRIHSGALRRRVGGSASDGSAHYGLAVHGQNNGPHEVNDHVEERECAVRLVSRSSSYVVK
jgi:hypothetical protein